MKCGFFWMNYKKTIHVSKMLSYFVILTKESKKMKLVFSAGSRNVNFLIFVLFIRNISIPYTGIQVVAFRV